MLGLIAFTVKYNNTFLIINFKSHSVTVVKLLLSNQNIIEYRINFLFKGFVNLFTGSTEFFKRKFQISVSVDILQSRVIELAKGLYNPYCLYKQKPYFFQNCSDYINHHMIYLVKYLDILTLKVLSKNYFLYNSKKQDIVPLILKLAKIKLSLKFKFEFKFLKDFKKSVVFWNFSSFLQKRLGMSSQFSYLVSPAFFVNGQVIVVDERSIAIKCFD